MEAGSKQLSMTGDKHKLACGRVSMSKNGLPRVAPVLDVPGNPSQPMTSPTRMVSTMSSKEEGVGGGRGTKWERESSSCREWPSCGGEGGGGLSV